MNIILRLFGSRFVKALLLVTGCIVTALCLSTYSLYDVSFNTASDSIPQNILDLFGSYYADILVQYFGYLSWLIIVTLFVLSYNLIRGRYVNHISLKILSCIIAIQLIDIGISGISMEYAANFHKILSKVWPMLGQEIRMGIIFSMIFIGVIFFFISLGLEFRDYLNILYKCTHIFSRNNSNENIAQKKATTKPQSNIYYSHETQAILQPQSKISKPQKLEFEQLEGDIFELPNLDLLSDAKEKEVKLQSKEELEEQGEELLKVLNEFGVKGNIIEINQGPVVTLYEFEPAAGTKSSRVISLADDIARTLCAISARIAVIPGRNVLGIELPNKHRQFFRLRELFESEAYRDESIALPIVLGKDLAGKPTIVDLAKMPHLLVAGTTGSGKSVAVNAMIISLLYRHSPAQCKFIMIDPKMLELSVYDGIPHLLSPVVTEPGKAIVALKWAVKEMENRYRLMSNVGVRNINGYNSRISEALSKNEVLTRTVQTGFDVDTGKPIFETMSVEMVPLPFIVVIVDEMADLMLVAGKDIESSIQRLAQMARAAGIHLIMATQRPSVDVITGVIKANFPSRVSFKVTSKIDSRTILGEQGAEQLLGMGDMLYMGNSSRIVRVHGPFVEDGEVERISRFLKNQASPEYITSVTTSDDEDDNPIMDDMLGSNDTSDEGLYRQALQIVKSERKSSTSYIQRSLRIGYNRAAILIEKMEKEGILSSPNHSGKREILIPEE